MLRSIVGIGWVHTQITLKIIRWVQITVITVCLEVDVGGKMQLPAAQRVVLIVIQVLSACITLWDFGCVVVALFPNFGRNTVCLFF